MSDDPQVRAREVEFAVKADEALKAAFRRFGGIAKLARQHNAAAVIRNIAINELSALAFTPVETGATPEPLGVGMRPTLPIIVDWYQSLPEGARAKLSLHHLHTLAKSIRDDRGGVSCPFCLGQSGYFGNPAKQFCDEHYSQYLSTLQICPADLDAYRRAALDAGGERG